MARSNVSFLFDADTAFVEAGTGQVITSSGNMTSRVPLDKMTQARADSELRDKLGAEGYKVVIAITAVSVANADETYEFVVQGTDAAGANPVTVGTVSIPAGVATPGQIVVPVDAATLDAIAGNVSDVELNVAVNVGGTSPSVTVGAAWMAYDRQS